MEIISNFASKQSTMTFDRITEDGKLWAVRYDGKEDNVLFTLFDQWNDVAWLHRFFKENIQDLQAYNKNISINEAIRDTIHESEDMEKLLTEISTADNLSWLFCPLENFSTSDMQSGKEELRLKRTNHHPSWLRVYAIKPAEGVYIITGGAIKLAHGMNERKHTQKELENLENTHDFLLRENIIGGNGFIEHVNTI